MRPAGLVPSAVVMMVHDDGDGSRDTEQTPLAQCASGSDFSV